MDFAFDEGFGFSQVGIEGLVVDLFAHHYQVEDLVVETHGQVAHQVGAGYVAEFIHHLFNKPVEPQMFTQDAVDVVVERMLFVGGEDLFVSLHRAGKQSRLLEPVQLKAYRVGTLSKLLLQSTEIAPAAGIQEETQEKL